MNVFLTANMKTFEDFVALYVPGDEKRVRWGKSLFIEALSNTDPAQRYPMCDFLLDRDCVLDAGTTDGTNPFHILFAQSARDVDRDVALCRRLLDRGVTLGQPDKNGCIPLVHLISTQEYSDEELTPLYDLVFASPDLGFDIELTGSHDTMYDVARRWPHRQALADRIARYLAAGSEKHTEEHA